MVSQLPLLDEFILLVEGFSFEATGSLELLPLGADPLVHDPLTARQNRTGPMARLDVPVATAKQIVPEDCGASYGFHNGTCFGENCGTTGLNGGQLQKGRKERTTDFIFGKANTDV